MAVSEHDVQAQEHKAVQTAELQHLLDKCKDVTTATLEGYCKTTGKSIPSLKSQELGKTSKSKNLLAVGTCVGRPLKHDMQ